MNSTTPTFAQFIGPVVGPLPRDAFVNAVGGFDLTTGFPDMKSNYHHFRVDPFETNRVWFQNRTTGTHAGKLAGRFEATGTKVECPPQALSMTFNESGKITKITVGGVMDRTIGHTGGLGGVLIVPEGEPGFAINFIVFGAPGMRVVELVGENAAPA